MFICTFFCIICDFFYNINQIKYELITEKHFNAIISQILSMVNLILIILWHKYIPHILVN